MQQAHFEHYRRLLGLVGEVRADLAGLRQVVRQHLIAVPFENVSKRVAARQGATHIAGPDEFLEGIEHYGLGGTCYTNNYYLHRLLRHLGFEARLCGADLAGREDVHMAVMVVCEGREYLVDCGFAAPFYAPLCADLASAQSITLGDERYVVQPRDAQGRLRVDFFQDNAHRYGYLLKPEARAFEEFRPMIAASFGPEAIFMKVLRIVRFSAEGALSLDGCVLRRLAGATVTRQVIAGAALPDVAQSLFRIPAGLLHGLADSRSSHAG
jgi:arylamine N-acetyltransferase